MISTPMTCLWVLVVWMVGLSTVDSHIRLVDGGYEDIVVEIHPDVPSHDCSAVFKGLEVKTLTFYVA